MRHASAFALSAFLAAAFMPMTVMAADAKVETKAVEMKADAVEVTPAAAPAAAPAAMEAKSIFTDAQKTEIEGMIKKYISEDHPEIVMQAAQEVERRERVSAEEKTKTAVKVYADKLMKDTNSPIAGNPKGDVTIIEFFDFQCGYCKMAEPGLEKLLSEDKNVKVIYKDFPILGPMSRQASKAALASAEQGKYAAFHNAVMSKKEHLNNDDDIFAVAKEVGLDVEKLKKDMESAKVAAIIEDNLTLGNNIGVRGTPMFIIGDRTFPGALRYEQLKETVDSVRKSAKK